ncbi:aminoglycoside phosphotransferase family protein [Actinotalea sp. BY-33]|uniref:Aminoglycoside phosphotransferase family protein n=2 Tax=Actinotalea soli TaxID=2819234 RepID=A0A939LSU0_9CELL|nr:aminoglycoside phosphotransferase family protein [Actinotalea soli]
MGGAVRVGDSVRRTAGPWTPTVHRLLTHLRGHGLTEVPQPLRLDPPSLDEHSLDEQGREVLSYVEGLVPHYPLPEWVWQDDALVDAGRLLAAVHRASASFDLRGATWQMPAHEPVEVVCHNDAAPYNMVFRDGRLVGLIDWDTASPGPRVWDLAYLAYRLVPLTDPANHDGLPSPLAERARRLALLCTAYDGDLTPGEVIPVVADRLRELAAFSRGRAPQDGTHLEDHARLYEQDARWVVEHAEHLARRPQ